MKAYSIPRHVVLIHVVVVGAFTSFAAAQEWVYGKWDPPVGGSDWDLNIMHAMHIPGGQLLFWWDGGCNPPVPAHDERLWNYLDGTFTVVPTPPEPSPVLSCAGHCAIPSGIMIGGGGCGPALANKEMTLYSFAGGPNGPLIPQAPMNYNRYYPTCITLGDSRVAVFSGEAQDLSFVLFPEIYTPPPANSWQVLINAPLLTRCYPFMFVLPDGDICFAGPGYWDALIPHVPEHSDTYVLNVASQTWTQVGNFDPLNAWTGSAVMYEPGKVLVCGGWDYDGGNLHLASPITAMIDFTAPSPQWEMDLVLWQMDPPRAEHNLVLLADGSILATGGEDEFSQPIVTAAIFDPTDLDAGWQPLAAMTYPAIHHAVSMLLPDGRVMTGGGDPGTCCDDECKAEIFSPPYLFQQDPNDPDESIGATRPTIGYAPREIEYSEQFRVGMTGTGAQLPPISKVTLLRLGCVSHGFDQNQRFLSLGFEYYNPTTLTVHGPTNPNAAPPGHYMLFLISNTGVPSVAKYVELH